MLIKEGTVICLETGEYSDYSFHGPFRALRDFDQRSGALYGRTGGGFDDQHEGRQRAGQEFRASPREG